MTETVLQLHKPKPCADVSATLRRIADQIDAREHGDWPVTTCVVLLGHTDAEVPVEGGGLEQAAYWTTFGAGPRCDTFTVRGLMQTCSREWESR